MGRVNVKVRLDVGPDGQIEPFLIKWPPDDTVYPVRLVGRPLPRASTQAGGMGMRYLCNFGRGVYAYLFNEPPVWFMEEKDGKPAWFHR